MTIISLTGDVSWDIFVEEISQDIKSIAQTINYKFDEFFDFIDF